MSVAIEKRDMVASIPMVTTALIGRDRDIAELERLLADPACRLLTLTGPGGIGKTRLAVEIATRAAATGPVAFVRLAAIRQPSLVFPAIGLVFGYISDTQGDYEDFLIDRLANERALLVLDNLEQVVSVAPSLGRLLSACPGIRILATSQAVLGITGEQLYPLDPLETPSRDATRPEAIMHSGAVALFVDRARATNPSLKLGEESIAAIAGICRQLDGLPLAIELAAARMNILSPEALLPRLDDRLRLLGGGEALAFPERMHTMRSAVAWSYELLGAPARRLLRWLSAFNGGFSLEAIEFVVETWSGDHDAYDLLGELVDRSLVRQVAAASAHPRYDLLATIRDFGLEQLDAAGEGADAALAQARFVAAFAERAEPELIGREQRAWLTLLDAEIENIRTSVGWALEHGREDLVLRIGGSVWRFLSTRGLVTEGRRWLERALGARGTGEALDRAKALLAAGYLAEDQRDLDVANGLLEQARHLAVAIGDPGCEHRALIGLGTVAHDRGEYDIARQHHEQATAIAREIADDRGLAVGLSNLAAVAYFQGDLARAVAYWDEGQEYLARIGDMAGLAIGACNLGAVYLELEEYETAERYLHQAEQLQRGLNSIRDLTRTLINLGEVGRCLGDYTLAHDSFAEAIDLLRDADDDAAIGIAMHGMAELALAQGDEPRAARELLESIRILVRYDDPHSLLECAHLAASLASRNGKHEWVVELIAADTVLREQIGSPRTPTMERLVGTAVAAAHRALGRGKIERCEEAGRELTLEALPRRLTTMVRELAGRKPAPAAVAAVEHPLTSRELEILQLLAQGHSTNEVAGMLFLSPRTVATHITNILGKLELSSRTAAVAWAHRNGLA